MWDSSFGYDGVVRRHLPKPRSSFTARGAESPKRPKGASQDANSDALRASEVQSLPGQFSAGSRGNSPRNESPLRGRCRRRLLQPAGALRARVGVIAYGQLGSVRPPLDLPSSRVRATGIRQYRSGARRPRILRRRTEACGGAYSVAGSPLSEFYPDLERIIDADVIKKLRCGIDLVIIPTSRKAGQFMDVNR